MRVDRVLVIGATGSIGSSVVTQLVSAGVPVRAMTRNAGAASFAPEVQVAQADLCAPETLDEAMNGIDAVFLVWTAQPACVASALERITKRARPVVFLSSPHKTEHPLSSNRIP